MGRWLAPAGLAAGVLTTTTTTNGPPLILYLFGRRVPAAQMRDTLSVLFVGFGLVGVAALVVGRAEFTLPRAELSVALAVAAVVGHVRVGLCSRAWPLGTTTSRLARCCSCRW